MARCAGHFKRQVDLADQRGRSRTALWCTCDFQNAIANTNVTRRVSQDARVDGLADTMSNRLLGALSGQRDPAITLCCASFHQLLRPGAWGHKAGAHDDFRGLERVPFCLDGSRVVRGCGEAKWGSKIGASRTVYGPNELIRLPGDPQRRCVDLRAVHPRELPGSATSPTAGR